MLFAAPNAARATGPANAAWSSRALPRLPLTGPQQSARLLPVPPAWSVLSFGGRCDGAAGSKAISGDLGRRRGRLFRAHGTRRGSYLRRVRTVQARIDRAWPLPPRRPTYQDYG